jgi:Fur family ferric uptake transcriptional regulator
MGLAHSPAAAPATLDAAIDAVRAHGLRASAARRLVLAALLAAERPVTADAIARGLDGRVPQSDVASVYRNLDALERVGLVRRLHTGHGSSLYTMSGGDDVGYVACERCGEVRVVDSRAVAQVRATVRATVGFEATFLRFPIVGKCPSCAVAGGTGTAV